MIRPDLVITLTADRKRGQWSFEISGYKPVHTFGTGFVQGATRQTLHSFALCAELKTLTRTKLCKMLVSKHEHTTLDIALREARRVNIAVISWDRIFVDACEAASADRTPKHRASKNVFQELVTELHRFNVTFLDPVPELLNKVKHFAERSHNPRFADGFPGPVASRQA
jgi:hypothetical protein